MRERPIVFSGPMVAAILAGRKTQTRRPVKDLRIRLRHEVASDIPAIVRPVLRYAHGVYRAGMNQHGAVHVVGERGDLGVKPAEFDFLCPYAEAHTYLRKHEDGRMIWTLQVPAGERLWVREALRLEPELARWKYAADGRPVTVRRDDDEAVLAMRAWAHHKEGATCSPIHMPRWASRLLLEVTEVRLEHVRQLALVHGDAAARAEGCADVADFMNRWASMYGLNATEGPFAWYADPWVWVVEFRRGEAARSAA